MAALVCAAGLAVGTDAASQPRAVHVVGRDTDRDGLTDAAEIHRYQTDPRKRDTDGDRLTDGAEVLRYHTNPRKRDTDGDGWADRVELLKGTIPRNARSRPGFPGADNTGVPPRKSLSPYRGPSTISTPNARVDGVSMGCIRVTAPGVVIRNSKISCADFSYAVLSGDGDYSGAPLLLEDSEIDCKSTGGTAIGEANVIVRRVNIHGCENGLDVNQKITVEDSYIHDMYNTASSHTDGIQFASRVVNGEVVKGVLNVTIRHNTIYGMGPDGSFGTSAIISNSGGDTNVLIENNLLAGGAYTLYCEANATGTNYRVINNRFSRKFGPKVGTYGPSTECSDEQQSGNVNHETGRPLRLP